VFLLNFSLTGKLSRRALLAAAVPCIVAFGLAKVGTAAESSFRVIVNHDNPITSANDQLLTNIFLKRRTDWPDGAAIRPVDLKADSPTRQEFSGTILRRSVAAVKSYWQQVIFSGRGSPPPELESDEAVIEYVAGHPGAIGYVSSAASLTQVKAITVR